MTWAVTDQLTNQNSSGATVVLTVNAAIAAGSLVVVGTNEASTSAFGTLADSQGNTYSAVSLGPFSGLRIQVFYSVIGTALSTSDTWTFTKGNTGLKSTISALSATGNLASSPLDTAVTATGSSPSGTSVTVTSGTPAVSGELFVGFSGDNKGKTWTQDTGHGWASPLDTVVTGGLGTDSTAIGGNQVNAGTSTIVYAPVMSGSATVATIIVGFKPSLANPLSKGYVFF